MIPSIIEYIMPDITFGRLRRIGHVSRMDEKRVPINDLVLRFCSNR